MNSLWIAEWPYDRDTGMWTGGSHRLADLLSLIIEHRSQCRQEIQERTHGGSNRRYWSCGFACACGQEWLLSLKSTRYARRSRPFVPAFMSRDGREALAGAISRDATLADIRNLQVVISVMNEV